jgi:hypothetical protein
MKYQPRIEMLRALIRADIKLPPALMGYDDTTFFMWAKSSHGAIYNHVFGLRPKLEIVR